MPTTGTHRALILAAGLGTRLRPLTADVPKTLIKVHGVAILENALRQLASCGVRETAIVVGYRSDAVEGVYGDHFRGMRLSYVRSDVFERTGSAYSMWLARDFLAAGSCLLLEGDVFFERAVLTRLLRSEHPDAGAVAPMSPLLTGSAATLDERGRARELRLNQKMSDALVEPLYKTINIYRFTAETLQSQLLPELDRTIVGGAHGAYVEQILSALIRPQGLQLGAVDCGDLNWFEIDSVEDLRIAERIFAPEQPAPEGQLAERFA
ncbi:phosphocholine cytidylyltransferase family protein [Steroidobacter sp. S1-65]|uniref:Phosphocholine cytidylyltransferase family protein n=1 Tax=Steroidobacter gossypii TaxID=2805490 RepID=A0ABS1WYB6_9GAMM|nr:phosphocholine cytidylyltransferase family protein [Steroidobacter gossypii]MBM0105963.1 phosphocholine cytidylyltransferase family protein [Steroidobacter gossypii]